MRNEIDLPTWDVLHNAPVSIFHLDPVIHLCLGTSCLEHPLASGGDITTGSSHQVPAVVLSPGSHVVTLSNKPNLAVAGVLSITCILIGRFDRGR